MRRPNSPISPQLADCAQNFLKVVARDLCTCAKFAPDRFEFAWVITERL